MELIQRKNVTMLPGPSTECHWPLAVPKPLVLLEALAATAKVTKGRLR